MNRKMVVPDHLPEDQRDLYREFCVAQMIQQLLVEHGATIVQAHKILGFIAARCALQLSEPEAVAQLGTGFLEGYKEETNNHYTNLMNDPVMKVRMSGTNNTMRRIAILSDVKRTLEMNINENMFDKEAPPPPAILVN